MFIRIIIQLNCVFLALADLDASKIDDGAFDLPSSPFLKLKAYKLIPNYSSKSNIMKIMFPRRLSQNPSINKTKQPSDDEIVSKIRGSTSKELEKDFVTVENILLIRDPKDLEAFTAGGGASLTFSLPSKDENEQQMPESSEKSAIKGFNKEEYLRKRIKMNKPDKFTMMLPEYLQRELVKRDDGVSDKSRSSDNRKEAGEIETGHGESVSVQLEAQPKAAEDVHEPIDAENHHEPENAQAEEIVGESVGATIEPTKDDHKASGSASEAPENQRESEVNVQAVESVSENNDNESVGVPLDAAKEDSESLATEKDTQHQRASEDKSSTSENNQSEDAADKKDQVTIQGMFLGFCANMNDIFMVSQ